MMKKEFSYRYMLLEQARYWGRRCMTAGFVPKKRYNTIDRARSYVSLILLVPHSISIVELDYIPARASEAKFHQPNTKTGGMRKDVIPKCCVSCGAKTIYFCIGCSHDMVGGMAHICSPSRDKNRGCWRKVHESRNSQSIRRMRVTRKREVQPSPQYKRQKAKRTRVSLNPLFVD